MRTTLGLLIFEDEEYARKILNDISYFRLIKAFSLNLKPKNDLLRILKKIMRVGNCRFMR